MNCDAQDWWDEAIERNRAALSRIVAVLFVYAGLDEGGADVVPRRVWRRIVHLLRPAESAARRLIVMAARSVSVEPPKPCAEKMPTAIERSRATGFVVVRQGVNLGLARAWSEPPAAPSPAEPRIPAFPLVDPLRRFDTRSWNGGRPFPREGVAPADPDEEVDAGCLCRRLVALKRALDDLPGQAKRLARWKARRDLRRKQVNTRPCRLSPMRPGWPPGHRKQPLHTVDDVLAECHSLARHALDRGPPAAAG